LGATAVACLSRDDFARQYAHGMVCRSHSTSHTVELVDPICSIRTLYRIGIDGRHRL
jgi:hypothetical protein